MDQEEDKHPCISTCWSNYIFVLKAVWFNRRAASRYEENDISNLSIGVWKSLPLAYDTEFNWKFVMPPHFGAITSSQITIFHPSHICAGLTPRVWHMSIPSCWRTIQADIRREKHENMVIKVPKNLKKSDNFSRALGVVASYAIK